MYEMAKDAQHHSYYEKSCQSKDLNRGRKGLHKPGHLMFFMLVFLRIKQVVNKLGSLERSK